MNHSPIQRPVLSAVIPAYQEAAHLERSIQAIVARLEALEIAYELILIDDGSEDGTWEAARNLAFRNDKILALRFSRHFGKEAAICAGLERSKGQCVLVMDCDGQHPPEAVAEMVSLWREGKWDVIEGVKAARANEPLLRRLGSKLFYALLSRLSGQDFTGASDFKLLDRRVVNAWLEMGERQTFFRGMSAWLGYRRKQLLFETAERDSGASRWSFFELCRLAITAVTSYSTFPLHLVTLLGLVFGALSLALGAQTLYMKMAGKAVEGFATVILLILIVGSVLMLSLGILGEYLARIYEEIKGRPRYVVSDQTGANAGDSSVSDGNRGV